jgi:hypothetical protein
MNTAFQTAVSRFQQGLTKEQRLQFTNCTKEDVEKAIEHIQSRYGSQQRLKHMRRLSKFIEGMSQLGQVMEVFVNVDATVAFIWVRIDRLSHTLNIQKFIGPN